MSKKLFGTDGVRGVANQKLTPELAFQIGQAAGVWLAGSSLPGRVVMGRDTRRSGTMLGAALAAGLNSAGADVDALGVAPTGAISWLARTEGYSLAFVISASHNPAPDNGIKVMGGDGAKAPAELEAFIEANLTPEFDRPLGGNVGRINQSSAGLEAYLDWLVGLVPERLDGMTVAVDGADGAAYELGPEVFRRLGATVVTSCVTPDGMNINENGGATKPETIQEMTRVLKADLGVAFDGDADRAVFSDSEGSLTNGDRTMALWCAHWARHGQLDPAVVVGTVMSNGGFEHYMREQGIRLVRTDVGDKYVSAKLKELGGRVGGEQSGHIIFPAHGPTGDGLVTALELARVLKREGKALAGFSGDFANFPQLLVNVEVASKDGWTENQSIKEAVINAEDALGATGRVNVRASGTQPMIRVMVESADMALRDAQAEAIVSALLAAQGGKIYSRVDLTYALGD